MFIGHFGVGLGAKRFAPRASLGTLFLAAQFVDLLWPTLLLAGLEQVRIEPGITRVTPLDFISYPISHSLVMAVAWGVLFGVVYWVVRHYRAGAIAAGIAVASHWLLDLLVHRPDLPLTLSGHAKVGLGIWNSLAGTLVVELAIFFAGLWLYARATRPRDRTGKYALRGLAVFLLIIYAINLLSPPPPSVNAIAWAGHAGWLIVIAGYWIDRHRITND